MPTIAVIDIGSNTLLLTIVRRTPQQEEVLLDQAEITRLGQGLQDGSMLHPEAKQRTLSALRRFKEIADSHRVDRILAAGTAAFRRAKDGAAFAQEIERELKIPVRILSGEEEAHYSFMSAQQDFGKDHGALGMIDIGGGSTELVFGASGPRFSLPIGTVKLTEKFIHSHPISDEVWNAAQREIMATLRQSLPEIDIRLYPLTWVAVAATPASLVALQLKLEHYDPQKIHGYRLQLKELEPLVEDLRTRSVLGRAAMPGMEPQRAELLPIGGAILACIMHFLKLSEVVVSDRGLRYGLLHEIA